MRSSRMIRIFTDRYPLIGPIVWMLSVQYFIIQLITALDWSTPFSVLRNTISDLGNTVCGVYDARYVCSPLHELMNASFILFGLTMAAGALLIYQEFRESVASFVGFTLLGLAGLGTILVGLFPENTVSRLHVLGASGPFLLGNIALVVLGLALSIGPKLRTYTLLSGSVALVALIFFLGHTYLGLGEGGMERIVAYPQTLWLIVFGVYMSRSRTSRKSRSR